MINNACVDDLAIIKRINKDNYFEDLKLVRNLFNVTFNFEYNKEEKLYINKIFYMRIKIKEISFNETEFLNIIFKQLIDFIFVNEYVRTINENDLLYQINTGAKLVLRNFTQELNFYMNKLIEENRVIKKSKLRGFK